MSGPVPTHQPVFTPGEVAACHDLIRRHSAPQNQVFRAKLALLLADDPTTDSVQVGARLGKHPNWVRYWRRIWAQSGFRLTDGPGRGRKPRFPPLGRGDRYRAGL